MSTQPLHPARTPEFVWVAQEVLSGWWVVEKLPSGQHLLMSACAEQLTQRLQQSMGSAGRPPALWSEWYDLRRMGWQDACQLVATILDADGRPAEPKLISDPERSSS